MKQSAFLIAFLLCSLWLYAAPSVITPNIRIDQFGYFPLGKKVAVISNPQTGFNISYQGSFDASAGANQYQVRRWNDDVVVFTGTLSVWNSGNPHAQSGDRGWWFDFTALTAPGSYYIFDMGRNLGSYRFEIGDNVYTDVLKTAVRTFFYQRINFPKTVPYADARWADGACFEGAGQDRSARLFNSANGTIGAASTAKDVSGGWMDAGDYNKYVTFAFDAVYDMLSTYRLHPTVFRDDYNIPESGNGIPDLLDEIKWEIEWLKRMQDASPTGEGLLLKVGVITNGSWLPPAPGSPPSTDVNPRYYLTECTSSTLSGAAIFSLASIVYRTFGTPAMIDYADDLLDRSKKAFARVRTITGNFADGGFQLNCDQQRVAWGQPFMYAGDADLTLRQQKETLLAAAVSLYEATGEAQYRTDVDNFYNQTTPIANYYWGPYYGPAQAALLRYTVLPGATAAVVSHIRTVKGNQNSISSINNYNAGTDLYRSYMPDAEYNWGSNRNKAYAGVHNYDFIAFNINAAQHALYKEVGESYLHWFHGVNPMGIVMLSNMYELGADSSVNEIYHAWFNHGTIWDNAKTSSRGPAPGYLTGGPNPDYGSWYGITSLVPPYNQPRQKAYRDWNTGWNGTADEASWSITEPSIHNQAVYVSLLARVIAGQVGGLLPLNFLKFAAVKQSNGVSVNWQIDDATDVQYFEVERSLEGFTFNSITKLNAPSSLAFSYQDKDVQLKHPVVYYRIKAQLHNGETKYTAIQKVVFPSKLSVQIAPNPVTATVSLRGFAQKEENVVLTIMNAQGVKMHEEQWQRPQGVFSKSISMEKFPAGVYWIKLITKEGTSIERVIRQ
jgi:hypothetical protein